jgi:hypothetical protein
VEPWPHHVRRRQQDSELALGVETRLRDLPSFLCLVPERRGANGIRDRTGSEPAVILVALVRAGSVPQGSRTGISGHQRSRTVQRNRRSPALQLTQQGRCGRAIRIVVPKVGPRRHRGSRRAATGVRYDRGARPQTVEDHDRRFCHRRLLTWGFSRVFPVLNTTQFLEEVPRADLARRKRGFQISSPPHQPWSGARRGRFHWPT